MFLNKSSLTSGNTNINIDMKANQNKRQESIDLAIRIVTNKNVEDMQWIYKETSNITLHFEINVIRIYNQKQSQFACLKSFVITPKLCSNDVKTQITTSQLKTAFTTKDQHKTQQ